MINLKKLREQFATKVVTIEVTPKTPEEIKAEQEAAALADAIERSGEAEKITYGDL